MPVEALKSTSTALSAKLTGIMAKKRDRIVLWSPAAKKDLIDIWGYFARVASSEVADKLLHEITWAAARIASVDPRMWRLRTDIMPDMLGGLRSAPVHPYVIFYRTTPQSKNDHDDVEIIRVLHQQRDLPSILSDDDRR
jgi:plasmid stabilization system protein ParE